MNRLAPAAALAFALAACAHGGAHADRGGTHADQAGAHAERGGANADRGGAHADRGGAHADQSGAHADRGGAHADVEKIIPSPPAVAGGEGQGEGGAAASPSAPPGPVSLPITVAAVGDVMLGSAFPDEKDLPPDDGAHLLDEVAPLLTAADVAMGNLEGPLADSGTSEKCARSKPGRCYAFRVPTRYAAHLRAAGFTVMSVANNHAGDFGAEGRASTLAALFANGIAATGLPGDPARLAVRGTRIAVLAFATSDGTNDLRDLDGARRLVAEARRDADLVLVTFHGGAEGADRQHVPPGPEEFLGEDRGDLRAFAHAVVDAGAALVVGHGPHVVRGMELYRGRLVAYSLGNFATWAAMNLSGPNGLTLVLEARLAKDGRFLGGAIHAARQPRPGGPRLDPSREVVGVVRRLSREDFGAAAADVADDGAIAPPAVPPPAPAGPGA